MNDDTYRMTGGLGTIRYMAPEVANHEPYNEKVDVYSFALITWQMFSCVKPFLEIRTKDAFYTRVFHQHYRYETYHHLISSCVNVKLNPTLLNQKRDAE